MFYDKREAGILCMFLSPYSLQPTAYCLQPTAPSYSFPLILSQLCVWVCRYFCSTDDLFSVQMWDPYSSPSFSSLLRSSFSLLLFLKDSFWNSPTIWAILSSLFAFSSLSMWVTFFPFSHFFFFLYYLINYNNINIPHIILLLPNCLLFFPIPNKTCLVST